MEISSLVSIVIPTYNQHLPFLEECITSAINQTYSNIEIIISDNHSSNQTSLLLEKFQKLDHRIKVVKPASFLPMTPHFDFAIRQASGKYFSILCSDDWASPDWLQHMISAMELKPNVTMGYCEVAIMNNQLTKTIRLERNGSLETHICTAKESFKRYITTNHGNWIIGGIIKTEAYHAIGGIANENIIYANDNILLFKLLEYGGNIYYHNEVLTKLRGWDDTLGKTEGHRTMELIADDITIFRYIRLSERFRKYLNSDYSLLNILEKKRARMHSFNLFIAAVYKKNTKKDIANGFNQVLAWSSSPIAYTWYLCNNRLGWQLFKLYKKAGFLIRKP